MIEKKSYQKDFDAIASTKKFIFPQNLEIEDYEGDLAHRKYHGRGKMTFEDGSIFEGEFVNNQICGVGIYYNANGQKYVGGWRNGLFHGIGTRYDNDNVVVSGVWENGELKIEFKLSTDKNSIKDYSDKNVQYKEYKNTKDRVRQMMEDILQ